MLAVSGKDRITYVKLCHNASKRPHVNAAVVGNPQHNLGRSVEPGLNVCVNTLVLESRASEVDYFNAWLIWLFKKDVFRFEIAVDDLKQF